MIIPKQQDQVAAQLTKLRNLGDRDALALFVEAARRNAPGRFCASGARGRSATAVTIAPYSFAFPSNPRRDEGEQR
jgi:hypothetical protein